MSMSQDALDTSAPLKASLEGHNNDTRGKEQLRDASMRIDECNLTEEESIL